MKKVIWRHPSAHRDNIWVESFEFKDEEGKLYLADKEESEIRVYLDRNKGIQIK